MDEVCALGVPDPWSGEVPAAFVVLGDEPKERVVKDDKEAKKIAVSILKVRSAKSREASSIEQLISPGLSMRLDVDAPIDPLLARIVVRYVLAPIGKVW